jgi:hypothetical protein
MENPQCLKAGFSFGAFDVGNHDLAVALGTATWINTRVIIEALGEPLLILEPPEDVAGPLRLSGQFYDSKGQEIFKIVQNEWRGSVENWDIEVRGPRIIIRRAARDIALQIRTEPPGKLTIERIDMFYSGFRIVGQEGRTTSITSPGGSTTYIFNPTLNQEIVDTLHLPDLTRRMLLSRLPSGVIFDGYEAGIVLRRDGQFQLGKGGKISMGRGGILHTFGQ